MAHKNRERRLGSAALGKFRSDRNDPEGSPHHSDIQAEPRLIDIADRIRVRLRRTAEDIIEIGRDLLEAKRLLPHGQFLPWIEQSFEMSEDSAARFMAVAARFGNQIPQLAEFAPSVLYLLAAPSTPTTVREAAIEAAQRGEKVTHAIIKRLRDDRIEPHKEVPSEVDGADVCAAQVEDLSPRDRRVLEQFQRALGAIGACKNAGAVFVPVLTKEQAEHIAADLRSSANGILALRRLVLERGGVR